MGVTDFNKPRIVSISETGKYRDDTAVKKYELIIGGESYECEISDMERVDLCDNLNFQYKMDRKMIKDFGGKNVSLKEYCQHKLDSVCGLLKRDDCLVEVALPRIIVTLEMLTGRNF